MTKLPLALAALLGVLLTSPCAAQTPLTGDWELATISGGSLYTVNYTPLGTGGSLTQSDEDVVWTRPNGEVRRYVLTPLGASDIIGRILHGGRDYTYVAHFHPFVSGGGYVSIKETLVPLPGDPPKIAQTWTTIGTNGTDTMRIMVTGPTVECPQMMKTFSYTFYHRKQ